MALHPVWKHYTRLENGNAAECNHCAKTITSVKKLFNLKRHIINLHPEVTIESASTFIWRYFAKTPKPTLASCRSCHMNISYTQQSTSRLERHLFHRHRKWYLRFKSICIDEDVSENTTYLQENTPPEPDVEVMSQTAPNRTEKYQLKWGSHQQNINVSLSNLYKNDRFADVMLLTCNGEENYTIPAHKLILAASSLYFANIFDKNPVPPNGIPYIVLPPDLTYRSMQVLLQYMYTGESTVSNDILNEVLRGGEILQIRGLWRTECAKTSGTDGYVGESNVRFVSPVTVTLPAQQASNSTIQQQPSQATPLIQVNRNVAIDPAWR